MVTTSEYAGSLPGTNDWTNSTNIYGAADASCGTSGGDEDIVVLGIDQFSSIPDAAAIEGFKVDVWWARSDSDDELYVTLACGSGTGGEVQYSGGGDNTDCSGVAQGSFGGATEMWGLGATTGDDVNDIGDVTITLRHNDAAKGGTLYVDAVQVTIYFSITLPLSAAISVYTVEKNKVSITEAAAISIAAAENIFPITDTSHYIKSGGASGSWTNDANMEGAPDGVCAISQWGEHEKETCYPVQFSGIDDAAEIYGIELKSKVAKSGVGEAAQVYLYCTSLGASSTGAVVPASTGNCSNVSIETEGGMSDLWGWSSPTGSDINGTDFYVHFWHNQGVNTIYWDSVEVIIYHEPSAEEGEELFVDAAVGIAGALGDWVIAAKRSASITITPAQMYAAEILKVAAIDVSESFENRPKILQSAAVGIAAAEDFPAYLKALSAALGLSTAEMYAAVHAEAAALGIATDEKYSAKVLKSEAIGISAVEALSLHFTKQVNAALGIATTEQYAALVKQAASVGLTAALEPFKVKALFDAAISMAEAQQYAADVSLSAAVNVAEAMQLAALKKAATALGIVGSVDFPKYLKALTAVIGIDSTITFVEVLKNIAASIDIAEAIEIGRLKALAASIGISGTVATDVFIKQAAALGITTTEQFSALLNTAAAISIGDAVLFPKYLKVLTASLSVAGSVSFPAYLKALSAAIGLVAVIENQAKTLQTADVGLAAATKMLVEIHLASAVGIGAVFDSWLEGLTEYCVASIGITTSEKMSVGKFFSGNVTLAATIVNMAKIFTSAGIDITDSFDVTNIKKALDAAISITANATFPAYKKALQASIGILAEFDATSITIIYAVADISVSASPTLAALIKIAETVDVSGELATDVKKFFAALIGVAIDTKNEPKKVLDEAISLVPVWSSPTYTQMIAWLVGDVGQPERLKAVAEYGNYTGGSSSDLLTEALTYSGGDGLDGAWVNVKPGTPNTIDLEGTIKVAGDYSIRYGLNSTIQIFPTFEFDSNADLSVYDSVEFWMKVPQEFLDLFAQDFYFILYGGAEGQAPYRWWELPLPPDDGWNKYTVALRHDTLAEGGDFDLASVRYMEIFLQESFPPSPDQQYYVYVDDLKFSYQSADLKAEVGTELDIATDPDFITEELTYTGGDWFDGEWLWKLSELSYSLNTTDEQVGDACIQGVYSGEAANVFSPYYHFDDAEDLRKYSSVTVMFNYTEPIGEYSDVAFGLSSSTTFVFGDMRWWVFPVTTPGWHEYTFQLWNDDDQYFDFETAEFDASNVTGLGFYVEYSGGALSDFTCLLDGIKLYTQSADLKADVETTGRLRAELSSDFSTSTDPDFLTEALSHSGGDWWDGSYSDQGYMAWNDYDVAATPKRLGSYSIEADQRNTPAGGVGWAYLFDVPPGEETLKLYDSISFWVYFAREIEAQYMDIDGFGLIISSETPWFNGFRVFHPGSGAIEMPSGITVGWHKFTFPLHINYDDYDAFSLDNANMISFFVKNTEFTYDPDAWYIFIDDIQFNASSQRLKAVVKLDDE